jgi:hypothetical protein
MGSRASCAFAFGVKRAEDGSGRQERERDGLEQIRPEALPGGQVWRVSRYFPV